MKKEENIIKTQIHRHCHNDGFILLMSLFLVILLAVLGAGLLWLCLCSTTQAIRCTSTLEARAAADAAHELAYFRLKKMFTDGDTQLPQQTNPAVLPGSDQTYTFTITQADDGGYDISATGYSCNTDKTVSSRAYRTGGSTPYGICVNEDIYFHGGTIDAYNSDNGPYGPGNQNNPLPIRMNADGDGDFYMGALASTPAGGTLTVGPDAAGDPEAVKSGQGIYNGTITAADEEIDFPPVTFDTTGMTNKGTLVSGTITSGTYLYDKVLVNQQTLTVKGHVTLYLTQECRIVQGSLQIANDGNSSLTIYCNGSVTINLGNMNTLTKDPKLLKIFGASNCQMVDFSQNPEFHGMIYAPNAELKLNIGNLCGAFMGRRAYIDCANIHYDQSLENEAMFQSGSDLITKRWQEQ